MTLIILKDQITINSKMAEVAQLRRWLREILTPTGTAEETIYDLELAVTEACTNIIAHAYGMRDGNEIIVSAVIAPRRITLTIRDFGKPFRPEQYQPPDLSVPHEAGYGIYLIHALMDDVSYDIKAEGGTALTLIKNR